MPAHSTVNRPVLTSTGTLARPVIDVELAEAEDAYRDQSDLIAEDTLVEEVSIDGMCGVY